MLRLVFLYRNLARNKLRTVLTCAAVALPMMIYVLSMAVVKGVELYLENSVRQLRLAVTHKASMVNPLPAGHRAKIESLDPQKTRLVSVCGINWLGGRLEGHPMPLSTLAADVDTFLATFPEYVLSPEAQAEWRRDPRAIIVGSATALQLGWKKGDRITFRPSVPPYQPMEFRVIAIAESATDKVNNFCRRDYLQSEQERAYGQIDELASFFFVKCTSVEALNEMRTAIDELFARSPDETKTQDEKTFVSEMITQLFNLPRNLTLLSAVTVFVAVVAAMNTVTMNFRDRRTELAALKALGFGGRLVFGLIQSESVCLCVVGGILGALFPYVAFTYTPLREYPVPLIQSLDIPPVVCLYAVGMSLVVGVTSAAWPAWQAMRLQAVQALRSLE
jgi:putative ABC transport system permease protein